MCWGERTTCASQFSPSTMWSQGSNWSSQAWRQVTLPAKPSHLPSSTLPYNWTETREHQYCETLLYRALIACSCMSSSAHLHWGHFPNYVCRNSLAPGARSKLIDWLHAVKAERLLSSALLGSNANSPLREMKPSGHLPITPQNPEQGLTKMSTCILFGDPSNKVLSPWCRPSFSSTGETARGHWGLKHESNGTRDSMSS